MGSGCGRRVDVTTVAEPDCAAGSCKTASDTGTHGGDTACAPEPAVSSTATPAPDGDHGTAPQTAAHAAASSNVPHLRVATWNMASVNNNPFEYWMTHDDERYDKVMCGLQDIIDAPSDEYDVPIHVVFTDQMWEELKADMAAQSWSGLDETEEQWTQSFRSRRIVSEFVKDVAIGEKRLASMPDRTTNTINSCNGCVYRPTPINGYSDGDMGDVASWWPLWRSFFFEQHISMPRKGGAEPVSVLPCSLLQPISRAKYPAVTEEEESISVPLSCLCLAIFDAILVHLLWKLSDRSGAWQELRSSIRTALGERKVEKSLEILDTQYADFDVVFLQEVAATGVHELEAHPSLSSRYFVMHQEGFDSKQDQNSVVLVSRRLFDEATVEDVYERVTQQFPKDAPLPLGPGDLVAGVLTSTGDGGLRRGQRLLVASFHGDTNGFHTVPVIKAVKGVLDEMNKEESERTAVRLVFGMDANTYAQAVPKKFAGLAEFAESVADLGLISCWGEEPALTRYTTFHARTYLQPQLNKAVGRSDLRNKGEANCKDHVLVDRTSFHVLDPPGVQLDNTGKGPGEFIEDMAFPTLQFPSDHALVSCSLAFHEPVAADGGAEEKPDVQTSPGEASTAG